MYKMKLLVFLIFTSLCISCNSQEKSSDLDKLFELDQGITDEQIGEYVTSAFEDSNGHLWFGTLSKGIARYDGNELMYFTIEDGLLSNRVTGVIEDSNGIFWMSTGEGLSKFDGNNFTNYRIKEDFFTNTISQLLIDSKGVFWIGTWGGVYTFDEEKFSPFPIPYPKVKTAINEDTKNWITEIREDPEGNIWFARDGYGACMYDGQSFVHYLKKDGLHSNNVVEIEFDKDKNVWFGTRVAEKDNPDPNKRTGKGGVNKLTNNTIISFPEIEGFNSGDVYEIYKDSSDYIWVSTTKNGVYRFDGKEFKHYDVPISIMGMMNDSDGSLWLAGAGGLYRINKNDEIVNVSTKGHWK